MGKVYQVCVMDDYENISEIGYYTSLDNKDLLDNINYYFKDEIVLIDEKKKKNFKLKKGDLKEYPTMFDYCFDQMYFFESGGYLRIFGFIYDLDSLIGGLTGLRKEIANEQ